MKVTKNYIAELIKKEIEKMHLKEDITQIPGLEPNHIRRINNWIAANTTALRPAGFAEDDGSLESMPIEAIQAIKSAVQNPAATDNSNMEEIYAKFNGQDQYNLWLHIKSAFADFGAFERARMSANRTAAQAERGPGLNENEKSKSQLILEGHRAARKSHIVTKNLWWQKA